MQTAGEQREAQKAVYREQAHNPQRDTPALLCAGSRQLAPVETA